MSEDYTCKIGDEYDDDDGKSYTVDDIDWPGRRGDEFPCGDCGAPVVWNEWGRAPFYRRCTGCGSEWKVAGSPQVLRRELHPQYGIVTQYRYTIDRARFSLEEVRNVNGIVARDRVTPGDKLIRLDD